MEQQLVDSDYFIVISFYNFLRYNYKGNKEQMQKGRSMSDFEIINRLGEGAFGQVFKVKRKQDGEIYALKKIKTVSMKEKDKINALNEIRILASMEGENIIGYKDSFYDEGSANLCIVLQFASKGDIMKLINDHSKKKKFIQQSEIWKAAVHIAKGLKSLHNNNILHRDLKSANIFISEDGTYKLGDLNISKVLKQGLAHTQTGTPYYCSPEVWQDKPYGSKSDIWSFGCVLYEMAAQKPPFTASDIQGLYRKICAGVFPRIPNIYSTELSDLINSMLKLNPSLRPTVHDILKSEIVKRKYQGQISDQQNKSANLLQTIQLNHKGWKNLNNNLPKSKYEAERDELQESNENVHNSLLVPKKQSGRLRPLSSKSDHNYFQNNDIYVRNRSSDKKNQTPVRQPSVRGRGERVMSAYGKRILNASDVGTPQKREAVDMLPSPQGSNSKKNSQCKNNNLALPPINPARRVRRASDNYEANMLPPRPQEPRRISTDKLAKNERPSSRDKLIQAGKQILNTPVQYRINGVGDKKIPPSPSNKRAPFVA